MLIEDGSLERTDDSWTSTRDLGDIDVPPTIDALLAARLEQLPRDEGMALETASVIGQVFSSNAVAAMADAAARSRLPVALDALVARDIVQTASELLAGDPALRFRHLLIRDAAYRRLPKASRSDLHERFAAWLEGEIGERIAGSEEIIGYHLEQAYLLRTELRPGSEEDRALASRAARRLASAGRRTMDLGDGLAASGLLGRAVALAGLEETTGIGFQLELAMALGSSGDLAGAEMALDAAKVSAQAKDLVGLDARIALEDLRLRMSMRPSGVPAEITRRVPGLIAILEREGDDAGLAAAWNLVGGRRDHRGHHGLGERYLGAGPGVRRTSARCQAGLGHPQMADRSRDVGTDTCARRSEAHRRARCLVGREPVGARDRDVVRRVAVPRCSVASTRTKFMAPRDRTAGGTPSDRFGSRRCEPGRSDRVACRRSRSRRADPALGIHDAGGDGRAGLPIDRRWPAG